MKEFDKINFCLDFKLFRAVNVVFFLVGDNPVSEFYVPTFRNTLSVPSLWVV
jgi:hypothetical protein